MVSRSVNIDDHNCNHAEKLVYQWSCMSGYAMEEAFYDGRAPCDFATLIRTQNVDYSSAGAALGADEAECSRSGDDRHDVDLRASVVR